MNIIGVHLIKCIFASRELSQFLNVGCINANHFVQIHGWPDISAGWRHQIPTLLDLGCRVVAPDMMGYGGTVGFLYSICLQSKSTNVEMKGCTKSSSITNIFVRVQASGR
jgi:hypothetical protein